jgi:hypothetical protein
MSNIIPSFSFLKIELKNSKLEIVRLTNLLSSMEIPNLTSLGK